MNKKYRATLKNGEFIFTDDLENLKDMNFNMGKNVLLVVEFLPDGSTKVIFSR